MRQDDWITQLDIQEKINVQKDFYWESGMMIMTKNYHLSLLY